MQTELEKLEHRLDVKERLEHRDALLAIAAFMATQEGKNFFKYLFKNLEVTTLPDMQLEGNVLHEKLGFLRAGNSIYQLACQAASDEAAKLCAQIEREKYEDKLERYRIEHGLATGSNGHAETGDND